MNVTYCLFHVTSDDDTAIFWRIRINHIKLKTEYNLNMAEGTLIAKRLEPKTVLYATTLGGHNGQGSTKRISLILSKTTLPLNIILT